MSARTKQVAAQLRRDARAYGKGDWGGDRDVARTVAKDCRDLELIAGLIEQGALGDAYDRASNLDTLVRDAISATVWSALEQAVTPST